MATVHLARILRDLQTRSVRHLLDSTGSPERSVFRQGQIAAIDALYRLNRVFRGPFGFPLGPIEFAGATAVRHYSGGTITFQSNSPQGDEMTIVRVRFVGFKCLAESS